MSNWIELDSLIQHYKELRDTVVETDECAPAPCLTARNLRATCRWRKPTSKKIAGSYFMNHIQHQYSADELAKIGVDLIGDLGED